MEALGVTGDEVEGYGKGALVGLDGEIEHGSAIIHTLTFGNPFRSLCGNAETLLPSAEKRGAAGSSLDLAIKHKMDAKIRSHHMTFETRIPDDLGTIKLSLLLSLPRADVLNRGLALYIKGLKEFFLHDSENRFYRAW